MMFKYLWILFLILTVIFALKFLSNKNLAKHSDKIVGLVSENRLASTGMGSFMYSPVIEYEYNGEKRCHISECCVIKPLNIGDKVVLFINKKNKKIVDTLTITLNLTYMTMFALVTVITLTFGGN